MRNPPKYPVAIATLLLFALAALSYGIHLTTAFTGPVNSQGVGSGALGVDSANNITIGTSTGASTAGSKLFIVGSSTNSTYYALQVRDLSGVPLLIIRNDGKVTLATTTGNTTSTLRVNGRLELASSTNFTGGITFPDGTTQYTAGGGSTISAANVSAGAFGSIAGIGTYTFPATVTVSSTLGIGTSTTPSYTLQPVNASAAATVGIRNSSASGFPGIDYLNNSGTANLYIGYDNANAQTRINSTNNAPIRILTNSTDAIFVSSTQYVGLGSLVPVARLTLGNNVATGFLDNYGEYQMILFDGASATASYGLGIKGNTLVFNSGAGAYSFDRAGTVTSLAIDTAGLITVGNRITGVSTPTGSSDAATKGYVDGVNFAHRWAGYTTTTYTGLIGTGSGGIKNGNVICNSNYAGSHWAQSTELIAVGSNNPWTNNIWMADGSSCLSWTSASGAVNGNAANTTQFTTDACNTSKYLACVY